jgi:PAS domain S-box-containing protein
MDKIHNLLRRQLRKIFGSANNVTKDFQQIVDTVNEAYFNFDEDRLMLERSIEISSNELVEANSRMRSILQAIPDVFFRIDANGTILECKTPADGSFKDIPEKTVGQNIYTLFGPQAASQLEWVIRRVLKNKTVKVTEYSVQGQTERFYEARVVWLTEDQLVVIVRNITERKLAEDSMRESQRMLQTLMSNLPGMAYRCQNDHERTIEFVSQGCFTLTGYQPGELIKNSKVSYNELIHPDASDQVWNTIQTALNEHKPFQMIYRINTTEGEQKWVWEQGQGVFSSKGNLLAIEGFVSDITDKMQMQESIKESERFLSEIFSSIQDGISVLDTNLNIVRTNVAMEKWYSHAMPLIGKKCYDAYQCRTAPCPNCPTCRTLETGKADYEIVPKTGPNGKIVGQVDLYSFPMVDEATGKLKGVIEYVRDIGNAAANKPAEQKHAELSKSIIVDDQARDVVVAGVKFDDGE